MSFCSSKVQYRDIHTQNYLLVQRSSRENSSSDFPKDEFVLFCSIIFSIRYVDNFTKNDNLALCLGYCAGQEEGESALYSTRKVLIQNKHSVKVAVTFRL